MRTTENAVERQSSVLFGAGLPRKAALSSSPICRARTVAYLDELKERRGLRNRGQVLEQLIEIGRSAAQQ